MSDWYVLVRPDPNLFDPDPMVAVRDWGSRVRVVQTYVDLSRLWDGVAFWVSLEYHRRRIVPPWMRRRI